MNALPNKHDRKRTRLTIIVPKRNMLARKILRIVRMIFARLRNNKFEYMHLSGRHDSEMGIVINSDLSISCNSDDMYGNGKLGSLIKNSLADILSGEVATRFRADLARGKLPINECANCSALISCSISTAIPVEFQGQITSILIENTAKCNLHCLSCNRSAIYKNRDSLVIKNADIDLVRKNCSPFNIKRIQFLNLGEPFASKNIFNLVRTMRLQFPYAQFVSSSNGSLLQGKEKVLAALMMDDLNFTIPGTNQASVERYQIGQNFDLAYRNMCETVRQRNEAADGSTVIIWKYLIFKWNDSDECILEAVRLAHKAGVDILRFVVCLSPIHAISLRYLGRQSLGEKVNSIIGKRHTLELIGHRHFDVYFGLAKPKMAPATGRGGHTDGGRTVERATVA